MNSRGSFIYTKSFPVKAPTPVAGFVNFITELHDSQKFNEHYVVAIFIPVLRLIVKSSIRKRSIRSTAVPYAFNS